MPSRTFIAASSQYLNSLNGLGLGAPPCTLSAWFRPRTQVGATIVSVSRISNLSRYALSSQAGTARATHADGSTTASATGTLPIPLGIWSHICGVFLTTSSRTVYTNGTNATTDTTLAANAMASIGSTTIGATNSNSAFSSFEDGEIALVGVWNVALSDADIKLLAAGVHPRLVRPTNCVCALDVNGDRPAEFDRFGHVFTPTAAPLKSFRSPIVSVRHRRIIRRARTAGGPLIHGGSLTHSALLRGGRLVA